MLATNKHFEIEARIELYEADKGRRSFISNGYRPHIYFGYSNPSNPNFASDCIIKLVNQSELHPGQSATVIISILQYSHLNKLLEKDVKIRIKEGIRFIGEGIITRRIGER